MFNTLPIVRKLQAVVMTKNVYAHCAALGNNYSKELWYVWSSIGPILYHHTSMSMIQTTHNGKNVSYIDNSRTCYKAISRSFRPCQEKINEWTNLNIVCAAYIYAAVILKWLICIAYKVCSAKPFLQLEVVRWLCTLWLININMRTV